MPGQLFARFFRKGIDHPCSASPAFDHSAFAQIREMLRDPCLWNIKNLLQVTDTERAARQQLHDAQPRLITKTFVDPDQ